MSRDLVERFTYDQRKTAKEYYLEGKSLNTIAKYLQTNKTTVRKLIRVGWCLTDE